MGALKFKINSIDYNFTKNFILRLRFEAKYLQKNIVQLKIYKNKLKIQSYF